MERQTAFCTATNTMNIIGLTPNVGIVRKKTALGLTLTTTDPLLMDKSGGKWRVVCKGNDNVQYTVIGAFVPEHCPGCGHAAEVTEIRKGRPRKKRVARQQE